MSLRLRATLIATAFCAVALTIGSVVLVKTLEDHLTTGADELARSRVHDLLDLAAVGQLPPVLRNLNDDAVGQVVTRDGSVVAATPNVAGDGPIGHVDPGADLAVRVIDAPDDSETETYRVWVGTGTSPQGPVTVYVGSSLESVREASTTLRRLLWIGVPILLVVLAALIWVVLGRALGRLDRIRAEVDEITEDRLSARIEDDGAGDEVGRLARTMNRMLARLEDGARRQRDFVADVSHDLQSPLAAQRVAVEVALAHPTATEVEDLGREVLDGTAQMEHLVGDLLVLAAADRGAPFDVAPLDVDQLVLEEAARARSSTTASVDTARVSGAPARANADDVRRIVRNLLDNAITHAAGRVELAVSDADGQARLDVVDDGPGVPPDDRERIFERFHRGDVSRTRHAGGSGLGLAIARTLAERNGGRLELADGDTGAHFTLWLPGV
jgi:signal transduction histidine kinase